MATINAASVTIHSFFQVSSTRRFLIISPLKPLTASKRQKSTTSAKKRINIIWGIDLLVVGEINMMRTDLPDGIDSTLRRSTETYLRWYSVVDDWRLATSFVVVK